MLPCPFSIPNVPLAPCPFPFKPLLPTVLFLSVSPFKPVTPERPFPNSPPRFPLPYVPSSFSPSGFSLPFPILNKLSVSTLSLCILIFPSSSPESSFPPFPEGPPPMPFGGCGGLNNLLMPPIISAAPAGPANIPGVPAFSNPKNLRINFSAGVINPIATTAYIKFWLANSIAEPTNTIYNNKCNGWINKLNIYSLNHILNACAFESFILSIGYVNATNGAIIVKNAIYTTLFKYVHVKIKV